MVNDSLTMQLISCFNNCFLPSCSLLSEKIKEHINCGMEVIEQCDDCLLINLKFDDKSVGFRFNISKENNRPIIRGIIRV